MKTVAGENQQVVGSSPSAGSILNAGDGWRAFDLGLYLSGYFVDKIRKLSETLLFVCSISTGGVPERSKGADCKSAGSAFGGSNPPPSTRAAPHGAAGGGKRGGSGCSSTARTSAFQADDVGSIPITRSRGLFQVCLFQVWKNGRRSGLLRRPHSSVGRALPW